MKTFLLSFFTVSCFLPFFLSGQSLGWKTRISSSAITMGPSAEFKATAVGPDGRIYSTGYFIGYRAQIGNTVLKADSAGFRSYFSDSTIFSTPNTAVHFPLSMVVTCHETNGTLVWAKTITSVTASDFGADLPDFRYLSGNKIAFDTQGNLILTGTYVGDTLKYDGVPFENNIRNFENSSLYRILILKISSTGSLLWGHSELNQSIHASTSVKSLRYQNGIIEALVLQPSDSSTTNKYSLFRYSDSGIRLPSVTYHPQGGANSWLHSMCSLPNGQFLIGSHLSRVTGGDGTSIISLLNADLSAVSHQNLSLYSPSYINDPGVSNNTTIIPTDVRILPDGQISLLMEISFDPTLPDWKLIMNSDTLDLPNTFPSSGYKVVMIRMSEPGCMKKAEVLDLTINGENAISPNSNWFVLHVQNWIGDGQPIIKMIDRNGIVSQSISLGNLGSSSGLAAEYPYGPKNTVHSMHWSESGVTGCYGSWLFKASLPDPVVADQSFSGCLSNRNLLLANEETLRPDPATRVFECQPGNWEIQGLPANGAHYQLMSAQGQTLLSGSTTSETARFKTKSLPVGIFYLRISDEKGNGKTLRVAGSR